MNEGVTNRFSATYDGGGTRLSKTDSWTGAHNYSWGPDGLVYDSAGNTIYTPGLSQQSNGVDRYPLHDWLGSTRYLTDSSQGVKSALRFDAYGNRSLTGGTDPYDPSDFQFGAGWGYQTEYASSTEPGLGLQLLGERYYDPAVGRFISQDPIGLGDYLYCGNDPVNGVDPTGLLSLREFATTTLVGGGIGFVASGFDPLGAVAGAAIFTGRLSYAESGDLPLAIADGLLSGTLVSGIADVAALGSTALAYQYAQTGVGEVECGTAEVSGPATSPEIDAPTAARFAAEEAEYGDLTPAELAPVKSFYSHLKPPKRIGPGLDPTPMQKRLMAEENFRRNGGRLLGDDNGEELVPSQKSMSGVTPPPNEAQVDHIIPKSKGGTNAYGNLRIISRRNNRLKSDKLQ